MARITSRGSTTTERKTYTMAKALTPTGFFCDRGIAWIVRNQPRCARHLFPNLPRSDRLVLAVCRRARLLALCALMLCAFACMGETSTPTATEGGAVNVAGSSGAPSVLEQGGAGGQVAQGGQAGSSTRAPCCALVDPAVMPAAAYACWCVELEQSECSQAYWDAQYRATPENPAPAWIPSGQCPKSEPPEGQLWCCARHAIDWRYLDQKDGCSCYLYSPETCQGMLDSLGEAAGAVPVESCP